jgi:RNA polymerase sigma-70 factor (ECF subfamily)
LAQDNKLIRSLIESSRKGNKNAFEQLFKMHVGYVYAISIRLLADFEDANENISKIFTEAWKTISMARRDSPFILWLKAIAIYSSLQKIREKVKDNKDNQKQTPSRKGLSFIDQEILSLPETERIIFVLSDIEHYQKEEISDLLTLAKEEVEKFLVNARETIMKSLVIKSSEALERAVKQIPESIEPLENLYDKIITNISEIKHPESKKGSALEQEKDKASNNRNSKQEKKRFSIKDLFKKKE